MALPHAFSNSWVLSLVCVCVCVCVCVDTVQLAEIIFAIFLVNLMTLIHAKYWLPHSETIIACSMFARD